MCCGDGKYRIFGTDERQNFYPWHFSVDGPEVEFDTEDEACDYIGRKSILRFRLRASFLRELGRR